MTKSEFSRYRDLRSSDNPLPVPTTCKYTRSKLHWLPTLKGHYKMTSGTKHRSRRPCEAIRAKALHRDYTNPNPIKGHNFPYAETISTSTSAPQLHGHNTRDSSRRSAQFTSKTHLSSGPTFIKPTSNHVSLAILPQPRAAHAFVHRRRPRSIRGFRSHGFGSDRAILGLDGDGGRSQATAAGAHGGSEGEVKVGWRFPPKEGS